MRVRGAVVVGCVALACAGCSSESPDEPAASGTPSETGAAPTPTSSSTPTTVELRYTVTPRNDSLLRITLPPQQPGGTMISWSAYF